MSRGKFSNGFDALRPGTVRVSRYAEIKKEAADSADAGEDKTPGDTDGEASDDTGAEEDGGADEEEDEESGENGAPKIWLEVLPSKGGLLLAALLTEVMTEGMTSIQMNILGNFVSAVGSLISYKASRNQLDEDEMP